MKKYFAFLLVLSLVLTGCGVVNMPSESRPQSQIPDGTVPQVNIKPVDGDEQFTDRDLSGDYSGAVTVTLSDSGITGSGVAINGSTVTITKEGTYLFTGTLTNGQICVNAPKDAKVQIVLSGAHVNCTGGAALYVVQADKVFVTLQENSVNSLSSRGEFVNTDDNKVDAAAFSKSDLTFNGTGSLTVECENGHGIVGKDDVKITSGSYTVTSAKQGITGKDSLRIADGTFTVDAGTDALHSKNEDEGKGYIYISGGTFDLKSGNDGLDAAGNVQIEGGTFKIYSGQGSASVQHNQSGWGGGFNPWGGGSTSASTAESMKGIKSASSILITDGSFEIDSSDDALHSNGDVSISGGTFTLATGDDGIHADNTVSVSGGSVNIIKSYEGIEGKTVSISGGEITLVASDDGLNASGGNDGSGMAGPFGGGFGGMGGGNGVITISGGTIHVNAAGDGIDSNGSLTVSGGTVYVDGPENSGNGALDYDASATITGGTVVALGASGMAQNFSSATQGSILASINGTAPAGTVVTLSDSTGKELVSYTSQKTFQCMVISCPELEQGKTYTLTVGTSSTQITLENLITGGGGGMGGPGGMGGQRPGGMGGQKPGRF